MKGRKAAVFVAQAAISAAFLSLAFRNIDLGQLRSVLASANPQWILLGIAFYCVSLGARIRRWKRMLGRWNARVTFQMCAKPFLASMSMNNFLPFRLGDVARLFAFNQSLGITADTSMACLVAERVLDVFVFTLALGAAIVAFGIHNSPSLILTNMLPACLAISGGLLLLLFRPGILLRPVKWAAGLMAAVLPGPAERFLLFVSRTEDGILSISRHGMMPRLLLDTVAIWILDSILYVCVAFSLPALQAPLGSLLAVSACALSVAVPSAPGAIGPFDYLGILSMVLLGNESTIASAFILLIHSIVLFIPLFCFLPFWIKAV